MYLYLLVLPRDGEWKIQFETFLGATISFISSSINQQTWKNFSNKPINKIIIVIHEKSLDTFPTFRAYQRKYTTVARQKVIRSIQSVIGTRFMLFLFDGPLSYVTVNLSIWIYP